MSPLVMRAANLVEQKCARDVEVLCPSHDAIMQHAGPVMRTSASSPSSDPFMDFLLNPMAPPPMLFDLSQALDDMMNAAVVVSQQPEFHFIIATTSYGPLESSSPSEPHVQKEHQEHPNEPAEEHVQKAHAQNPQETSSAGDIFDSMFSTLADRVAHAQGDAQAMDPVSLSSSIANFGNQILESGDADPERRRMARRLTEVKPEMFNHRPEHHHMPFGCPKNRCLMRAFDENLVSPGCFLALKGLTDAEIVEHRQAVNRKIEASQRESETFLTFASLYAVLAIATIWMLRRRFRKVRAAMEARNRLNQRVLRAVYSNLKIKELIEDELQEDIGFVPPLPPHLLARLNRHQIFGNGLRVCRMLKLFMFGCVLVLICVNPLLAMPLLCLFMLMRCCHLTCCAPDFDHKATCSCCCCGVDTDSVAKGELTEAQACCTCCKGTGVCAPGCDDCCGSDPCGCPCQDGCDCCDGGSSPDKLNSSCSGTVCTSKDACCATDCSKDGTVVVAECSCCCCGATLANATKGVLTKEQMCCTCCKGTGVCAPGCAECCGDDPCDCCHGDCDCCDGGSSPDKQSAYVAVPIQIV